MPKNNPSRLNFDTMLQSDVPTNRTGKHHSIVGRILSDLADLQVGRAIKFPLDSLEDSKENVRAALNRETRKRGLSVSTASDDVYLYVWQEDRMNAA